MATSGIVRVGENCWARERAERLAFLVDARAYFGNLAEAMERAEHSILIAGWDVHSRVRLRRDAEGGEELAAMLERLVHQRPELRVHLLIWDCNVLCAAAREKLQTVRLGWDTPAQIRFHLDGEHRLGACHHQKIVVIDDRVAFVGGIDLTARRWDTSEHEVEHEHRVAPSGDPYPPYHDVQVALSGGAARELGRLVRERWRRATGERLDPPHVDSDPWPAALQPALQGVDVGLARTDTAAADGKQARQIEAMYRDALSAARRFVYIENQYLTSDEICRSLCDLVQRPDGPEVCVVAPLRVAGWLEETVMGRLRSRVIRQISDADRDGRFRIWYPRSGAGEDAIIVHAKICVVDDRFLTVGSANLSNRSMGLDTECNVFLEASGDPRIGRAISGFRERLLGEHLDCEPSIVARAVEKHGSLIRGVESLLGNSRTLVPLEVEAPAPVDASWTPERLLDPEQPLEWSELVRRLFPA